MPAHPEEDPNVLREIQRRDRERLEREGLSEAAQQRIAEALQKAEDPDLAQWIAASWQRWQDAQAAQMDAYDAERELGEAAEQLEEAWIAGAIAWLSERWGNQKPCPYCGNREWSVGLPITIEESLDPVFTVTCLGCGNTVFINAAVSGLIERPGEPE